MNCEDKDFSKIEPQINNKFQFSLLNQSMKYSKNQHFEKNFDDAEC